MIDLCYFSFDKKDNRFWLWCKNFIRDNIELIVILRWGGII